MSNILLETIIFLFFVFFGAFLAAAEIALSSIGENKIEELKQKKSRVVSYFELIQQDPESIFGSIQLLYTVSRILTAIIGFPVAIYFINYLLNLIDPGVVTNTYSVLAVILAVIAIAFLIIVFCLLIPKAIGFKYANGLAVISIKPLYWISRLFRILVKILTAISNFLLKPIKEKTNFSQTRPSEDEILEIISDGVKSGAIDETEQEIIENVLEFNDLKAHEVMIPSIEMVAIDLTDENETRLNEVIKTGHSLIP
ncbi:MAG: CNNM domain-containing protein, partial [Ignavibacteriaceae bacterium]